MSERQRPPFNPNALESHRRLDPHTDEYVWLTRDAIDAMRDTADMGLPNESGGVLMGYTDQTFTRFVVTQIIGPGPNARHTPTTFEPDALFHEREIARRYATSGRRETYLGDWHTHPGAPAYLSRRDHATLARIAATASARIPVPLMVILGNGPDWTLAVWRLATADGWRRWLGRKLHPIPWRIMDDSTSML